MYANPSGARSTMNAVGVNKMDAGGFNPFGAPMRSDKALSRYLRSNLFSNFLPGQEDIQSTANATMSAPFTKQMGGGVGNMGYQNQLTMSEMNPAMSNLTMDRNNERNTWASLLQDTGSSLGNMHAMMLALQTMRDQINQAGTADLGGALGSFGGGIGL